MPRGRPSTMRVFAYWYWLPTAYLSCLDRLINADLHNFYDHAFCKWAHPHGEHGPQFAGGKRGRCVHRFTDIDAEGIVGSLAVKRTGVVVAGQHAGECAC